MEYNLITLIKTDLKLIMNSNYTATCDIAFLASLYVAWDINWQDFLIISLLSSVEEKEIINMNAISLIALNMEKH